MLLLQKWINFWIFNLVDKKLLLPSTADIYAPQSGCCWSGFIGLFRSLKLCNKATGCIPASESFFTPSEPVFIFPYRLTSFFFLIVSSRKHNSNSDEGWMCYLDRNFQVFISCQTRLPITGDSPVEFLFAHIPGSCMLRWVFFRLTKDLGKREALSEEFGKVGNV